MKKHTRRKLSEGSDTMRPEYDFSKGVRGKHAARYADGTNVVILEPDVAREFRTTEQVNTCARARPTQGRAPDLPYVVPARTA
jgi:hypothetical protein